MKQLLLVNIAGFASDGRNKSDQLKLMFPDAIIRNVLTSGRHPDDVLQDITFAIQKNTHPILVGSSLGGFYAHLASVLLSVNAVLINPSLQPWLTLRDKIGTNRYYGGASFAVKKTDLDEMEKMVTHIDNTVGMYDQLDSVDYALFTGGMDDRLDHKVTRGLLKYPTIDCVVAGFDHQFVDISIIKSSIEYMI